MIGVSRNPDSVIQVVPVISPLPFREYQLAKTGLLFRPRGKIAVTPVRTGPFPRIFFPCPEMMVLYPTSTPFTSVMALNLPVVPIKGMPRSLALGFCANTVAWRSKGKQNRIAYFIWRSYRRSAHTVRVTFSTMLKTACRDYGSRSSTYRENKAKFRSVLSFYARQHL
jgi:hypothetical protein